VPGHFHHVANHGIDESRLMGLTLRPTGLGHGVYKDAIDYNIFSD
jgi:hypothetical protein